MSFLAADIPAVADNDNHEGVTPELAEQLDEAYQQKQALTKTQKKIDQYLLKVTKKAKEKVEKLEPGEKRNLKELSTPMLHIDDEGSIEVKLAVKTMANEQLEQLREMGMDIRLTLPKYRIIEGSLPYDQVEAVAGLDFVVNVGTPGYAITNTGDVTSAGDTVLRAAEARSAFGVNGYGVKVGAMSDGVTNRADSVASGDLPSSPAIHVIEEGLGDEGTAMLEIIHDLAPGAPLAFYSPTTSSDMVYGIGNLTAAGCKVIVDDLTFFNEPKFEDGPIAQAACTFYNQGGVYVSSAGNSGYTHYQAAYNPSSSSPGGGYVSYHDYGGGDMGNTFYVPPGRTIYTVLQWNNQWGTSGDDLDLFLIQSNNGKWLTQGMGQNIQDGDDDPYEFLAWQNTTGASIWVYIGVFEYSLETDPDDLIIDFNVYRGTPLEYQTANDSLIGHAAVEEVLSTAAAYAGTPDDIEDFSSRGPATVYFPSYQARQVPNITGVDGVQTKTGQLGHFYNPFYGTSASAPHVAAIAALVWNADPNLSSSEVFNAITSTAVDQPPSGWDGTWGFGRADAYAAVESVLGEIISFTITDYGDNDIQFGNLFQGATDQPADCGGSEGAVTLTVGSETNVDIDIKIRGDNFSGPGTISISNVKYDLDDDPTGAGILDTDYAVWYSVAQPLTDDDVRQSYYWISIPGSQTPGTYTSKFYFQAVKSP
jgi:subtilisin family serine protease